MAQLARGSVTDRPWGMTLGALGMRGLTGELTVLSAGKRYRVAFQQGAVVGAYSPLASDAAVRLALTGNLITSTQVSDITRRLAAAPDRDEVDLLAELARLTPEQAMKLRRRLVAQRAARTFAIDQGDFVVDDQITVSVVPGSELDIRAVVFLGATHNLSDRRLDGELALLGDWFKLKEDALGELAQFGFTGAEKPILQMLVVGASVADIAAAHPSLDGHAIRAVVYALVSCGACELGAGSSPRAQTPSNAPTERRVSETATTERRVHSATPPAGAKSASPGAAGSRAATPPMPRGTPPPGAQVPRGTPPPGAQMPRGTPAPGAPSGAATGSGGSAQPPGTEDLVRMRRPTGQPPMATTPLPEQRPMRNPSTPPARRAKRDENAIREIEQLLASKLPLLDRNVDHFTLLDLSQSASADEIRNAYFALARKLHPDRLSAIGLVDDVRNAQRLMAQINAAFAVLNDTRKREEYVSVLLRGGEEAVRAEEARADELAMRVMEAEEAFKKGELALRRDQLQQAIAAFQAAVELQPNESEYQAMLAWAQFAAAADKNAIAAQTRTALTRAAEANARSVTARFYLGRVERMLGREREALQHFQSVLRIKPSHAEASSEARILEQRLRGKR